MSYKICAHDVQQLLTGNALFNLSQSYILTSRLDDKRGYFDVRSF